MNKGLKIGIIATAVIGAGFVAYKLYLKSLDKKIADTQGQLKKLKSQQQQQDTPQIKKLQEQLKKLQQTKAKARPYQIQRSDLKIGNLKDSGSDIPKGTGGAKGGGTKNTGSKSDKPYGKDYTDYYTTDYTDYTVEDYKTPTTNDYKTPTNDYSNNTDYTTSFG